MAKSSSLNLTLTPEQLTKKKKETEENTVKGLIAISLLVATAISASGKSPEECCDIAEEMVKELEKRDWKPSLEV